jgi:hypothetical protein
MLVLVVWAVAPGSLARWYHRFGGSGAHFIVEDGGDKFLRNFDNHAEMTPPPPKPQKPSAKEVPSLWVQLPDVHTTRVLFAKDKLPDGFMFQPVTIALSLNIPRPSAKTTYP